MVCKKMISKGSDTIRRCDSVAVSMPIGGSVSWGWALRFHLLKLCSERLSSLPIAADQDLELSAPSPAPCLPHASMSHHDNSD